MIHRNPHKRNFTQVSNKLIRDKRLSLQAKGLMLELLHFPNNWVFSESHLLNLSRNGKDALHSAVIELEKAGYIKRVKTQRKGGKFAGYEWEVFEVPAVLNNRSGLSATVNPHESTGKTVPGNPQILRRDTKTFNQHSQEGAENDTGNVYANLF